VVLGFTHKINLKQRSVKRKLQAKEDDEKFETVLPTGNDLKLSYINGPDKEESVGYWRINKNKY
jgi:hypothetical protein